MSLALLILLVEGFITISLEILTIRQLTPFFGNSVIITSLIIGVFLLFLALGYWRGSLQSDDFLKKLRNNFIASLVGVGLGLSYAYIAFFFYITVIKWSFAFLYSLTLYLLLTIAPIVYWLGQTIPLTTNLFNQQQRISQVSGRALFISTLGSFLGAVITSLLFFQFLGVAWTIVINCLLIALLIIITQINNHWSWQILIFLIIVLFGIKLINVDYEHLHFKLTNNYGNYQVHKSLAERKILEINLSPSSLLTSNQQGFAYINFIQDLLFKQLKLKQQKILVIGAGGFSLTAAGTYGNQVSFIDIDPDIKHFAEHYFLEKKINGKFLAQDARAYLSRSREKFAVIISDVYSHQSAIPNSLLTTEYFQQLAKHLQPKGLMIANILSNPLFNDAYSQRINNTIHQIFPFCAIMPLSWQHKMMNVIYVCSKQEIDESNYNDNLNTAALDYFKSQSAQKDKK